MTARISAAAYWGKSDNGVFPIHLVDYHSLDVAAVCMAWLDEHPRILGRWGDRLGMEPHVLRGWLTFLISIHDIGKFAEGFQARAPEVFEKLRGRMGADRTGAHHTALGQLLVARELAPGLAREWAGQVDGSDAAEWEELLAAWFPPVTGHHGEPPRSEARGIPLVLDHVWDAEGRAEACRFFAAMYDLHVREIPKSSLDSGDFLAAIQSISWHVAGFAVMCDWLGSNAAHFPPSATPMSVREYWEGIALPRAMNAVEAAGIGSAEPSRESEIGELFTFIRRPTPMQVQAATIGITGPSLFIIEDSTGSGKTEAALHLAHRIMAAGHADGFYLGLPTTATADAMHRRLDESAHRFFRDSARASLVVAHGRKIPRGPFRDTLNGDTMATASTPDVADGRISCAGWIADNRKKSLLAHIGVGTVDQALLGTLPVRHQSLRLFGLAKSVLIVDEVHAYDDYTSTLLVELVTFHASTGGSVILLTATMSQALRARLAQAYATGAGWSRPTIASTAFPLLTKLDGAGLSESPVESNASERRTTIQFLDSMRGAERVVQEAASAGRSVCWIRNTVADVGEAAELLGDLKPLVFHAAFTTTHRADIEATIRERVGPTSGTKERTGFVVVATQVIEQSLDVDFDVVVTDLAPVDLIIQRAGRLHRHARNATGDVTPGEVDARPPPVLFVHAPPEVDVPDETWFSGPFRRASHVYPAHDRLWLTYGVLRAEGALVLPARARHLIESVHGEGTQQIPDGLARAAERAHRKNRERRSRALVNVLRFSAGYCYDGKWDDEDHVATRDGEPSRDVFLAVKCDGAVKPLDADSWHGARITIAARRIARHEEPPGDARFLPDKGRWSVLIEMAPTAVGWEGRAHALDGRLVRVTYSKERGLQIEVSE